MGLPWCGTTQSMESQLALFKHISYSVTVCPFFPHGVQERSWGKCCSVSLDWGGSGWGSRPLLSGMSSVTSLAELLVCEMYYELQIACFIVLQRGQSLSSSYLDDLCPPGPLIVQEPNHNYCGHQAARHDL